jgi:membrane protein YqaA with SNARE-associated domain
VLPRIFAGYAGRIACASGSDRGKLDIMLGRAGLAGWFEDGRLLSGTEMPRGKPAPDVPPPPPRSAWNRRAARWSRTPAPARWLGSRRCQCAWLLPAGRATTRHSLREAGVTRLFHDMRVAGAARPARLTAIRASDSAPYTAPMDSTWINDTLAWIGAHPLLAGAAIFAIAFCDAVIILGALVPALPLLFAVGVLIGLGEISGPYAVASAAVGAFAGDAISYWVGWRWGDRLRGIWPFSRYPQLLERGETLFRRNAAKSILIARYVGAIRPFVPAIAGIARMPFRVRTAQCIRRGDVGAAVPAAGLGARPCLRCGGGGRRPAAVRGEHAAGAGAGRRMDTGAVRTAGRPPGRCVAGAHPAWSARHPVLGHHTMAAFDPARRESSRWPRWPSACWR